MRRDPEVEALRERIDELEAEMEKLREALRTAQHWHEQLDYDEALNVIDAALVVPLPDEPKP